MREMNGWRGKSLSRRSEAVKKRGKVPGANRTGHGRFLCGFARRRGASAVQTGLQGLHRSPQLLQIGKAGVQLFPGGGAIHIGGEIQRLQLRGGAKSP